MKKAIVILIMSLMVFASLYAAEGTRLDPYELKEKGEILLDGFVVEVSTGRVLRGDDVEWFAWLCGAELPKAESPWEYIVFQVFCTVKEDTTGKDRGLDFSKVFPDLFAKNNTVKYNLSDTKVDYIGMGRIRSEVYTGGSDDGYFFCKVMNNATDVCAKLGDKYFKLYTSDDATSTN